MTIRECPVCGREFEAYMRQKYCTPECAEIADLKLREKRCEKEKEKRAKAREERERKKRSGSLVQDAMDAREQDMTYGKYMAEKYKVTISRRASCSRGDNMSNFSQAGNIKCPYYVNAKNEKKEANYITCEGNGYARYYTSKFKNKEERNKHITEYCAKYPNKCTICMANDTKFQREER
jgi:hypothetical protein